MAENKKTEQVRLDLAKDFAPPTHAEWRAAVDKLLKGAPYEKIMPTKTYEGITLKPMYRKDDVSDLPHISALPGQAPFVRGTHAGGYLSEPWQNAQEIDVADPAEYNQILRHDLQNGQTAINLRLDVAGRNGFDSDHAPADQVGRDGVTVSTMEDFEKIFADVDISQYPLYLHAGASGLVVAAFLASYCQKHQIDMSSVKGAIGADPLGELAKTGQLPHLLSRCYEHIGNLTTWAAEKAPGLQTMEVDAGIYGNAGGSATEELAFALATGAEYLQAMLDENVPVNVSAPRIRFKFSIGSNFFMEIAKLRAAKLTWSKIVAAFGGNEAARKMTIHAQTGCRNKTELDPYVNMLRNTTEAFSAVMGGIDSMHIDPFDKTVRSSDEFSRRIARNLQTILSEECRFNQLIDPAGGSWYIESLTDELANKAWELFQKVEELGGMLKALQAGFPQEKVAETAAARVKNLATRKDKIVGVNMYANLSEQPLEKRSLNHQKLFEKRSEYLNDFRTSGDVEKHLEPLNRLNDLLRARADELFAAAVAAVSASATIGEVSKTVYTSGSDPVRVTPLPGGRAAEPFENLRKTMWEYQEANNNVPEVFLANMGAAGQHKARADFSAGFFQVAGFETISPAGFKNGGDAADAALKSGAPVVVICSSDPTYPELVPVIAKKIKSENPGIILVLAGYPKDQIEAHQKSGIDYFIHIKANALQILSEIMQKVGVRA